jgi:hypothetical protein
MTSQTLINHSLSQFSTVAASCPISISGISTPSEKPKDLPYQATHQVELLHLQAETEALLQEIQTAKLQRHNLAH